MVRKLDKAIINAKVFATHTLDNMKRKVSGDETLIIKIMLMVIAVALVIIFRDTLQTIIKNLLTGDNGLEDQCNVSDHNADSVIVCKKVGISYAYSTKT